MHSGVQDHVTALPAEPRPKSHVLTPELIRRHQAGVWRYLRLLGCDEASADDLTQDAFLALLRQPPESTEPAATGRWLRTTALRLFRNHGVRSRNDLPLDEVAIEAAWSAYVESSNADEVFEDLDTCMQSLPTRMHHALKLRYESQGSRQAVAAKLSLNDEGAKTILRRARERLSQCLQNKRENR